MIEIFMQDPLSGTIILSAVLNSIFCAHWMLKLKKKEIRMPEHQREILKPRMRTINRHVFVLASVIFVEIEIIIMCLVYVWSGVVFGIPMKLRYVAFATFMSVILYLIASSQCSVAAIRKLMQIRNGDLNG